VARRVRHERGGFVARRGPAARVRHNRPVQEDDAAPLLVLGAGYVGAALADVALAAGRGVVLADNWYATRREQVEPLEARGAQVRDADVRSRNDVAALLDLEPSRLYLLAAQASRPLSDADPDYTEATNVTGVRHVAEAVAARGGPPVVFGSSLHVYGSALAGEVGPDAPYAEQRDLAHLTKIAGELLLLLHARRAGFDVALLRLGIVYGPSPVQHDRPESVTVVNTFRRLAAAGEPLPLDDGGRATIGVVHVEDAARILLDAPHAPGVSAANVAAETVTVADVAGLAQGRRPAGEAPFRFVSPFPYRHRLAEYLRP
jgi:nucleoside-diphosphate-sugar epimerase